MRVWWTPVLPISTYQGRTSKSWGTGRVSEYDRLFRELLAEYPGAREQDNAGDGFLAVFATPGDAVAFALRYHQALAAHAWGENVAKSDRRPTTRIGRSANGSQPPSAFSFAGSTISIQ